MSTHKISEHGEGLPDVGERAYEMTTQYQLVKLNVDTGKELVLFTRDDKEVVDLIKVVCEAGQPPNAREYWETRAVSVPVGQ